MKRRVLFVALVVYALLWTVAQADVSQKQKFIHADKNKDGVVDKKEMKMEKGWEAKQKAEADLNNDGVVDSKEKRLSWKKKKSRVNTPVEQKYDKDNDGYLDANEAREMLKDKSEIIKTDGRAKVDTPVEALYDFNKDGVIDQDEANIMRNDLKDEWRENR